MCAYLFTSESVSMGHPDKVADQISDAVLDAMLAEDPQARVACETMVSTGMAIVAGEVTTKAYVEIPDIVRRTIREIGYIEPSMAFDHETCAVLTSLKQQSTDIAMGVNREGAGDQGMMFGYACRETDKIDAKALMPLPIFIAHRLVERHAEARVKQTIQGLRPDAKSQVTLEYNDAGHPTRIDTVVLSTQHTPDWNDKQDQLKKEVIEHIIKPTLADLWHDDITIHVNPTGRFEIGGPHGDVGLTGRKIIVDTYGGAGRHGGGAFSGKDPTKVDRSAAYMARYIAKNIVAARLTDVCEIQLSYAIGVAEPTSVRVSCVNPEVDPKSIENAIRDIFSLTPRGIIESLGLRKPIYRKTATHGHFGRKPEGDCFHWERLDKVDAIKQALASASI